MVLPAPRAGDTEPLIPRDSSSSMERRTAIPPLISTSTYSAVRLPRGPILGTVAHRHIGAARPDIRTDRLRLEWADRCPWMVVQTAVASRRSRGQSREQRRRRRRRQATTAVRRHLPAHLRRTRATTLPRGTESLRSPTALPRLTDIPTRIILLLLTATYLDRTVPTLLIIPCTEACRMRGVQRRAVPGAGGAVSAEEV